jgi:hypothetical protein
MGQMKLHSTIRSKKHSQLFASVKKFRSSHIALNFIVMIIVLIIIICSTRKYSSYMGNLNITASLYVVDVENIIFIGGQTKQYGCPCRTQYTHPKRPILSTQ